MIEMQTPNCLEICNQDIDMRAIISIIERCVEVSCLDSVILMLPYDNDDDDDNNDDDDDDDDDDRAGDKDLTLIMLFDD